MERLVTIASSYPLDPAGSESACRTFFEGIDHKENFAPNLDRLIHDDLDIVFHGLEIAVRFRAWLDNVPASHQLRGRGTPPEQAQIAFARVLKKYQPDVRSRKSSGSAHLPSFHNILGPSVEVSGKRTQEN